ncbi:hypothetical protein [Halalkalibacter okhensis]|uniref:Uncharacterized protein n=1 Tax=Halalkalibacter okhensis TaxID=333138 RepID=A0A0B0IGG7_9BACI|nr:hypothetical protein [Halalkalibacter okhensis]KHF41698.1 hypothetical protein LQ50_03075 [Halalkalibacter okhensis]
MRIHLLIFISSVKDQKETPLGTMMMKTFESTIRPVNGDIIDDPGFHQDFHNGYEVVKVTINYDSNECYVSLAPLVLEREDIPMGTYIEKLENHGWRSVSNEELKRL